MAFVRTLLAAWLAVAVTLLPATCGAAVIVKAAATVMSDPAAMPCCDHMDQCGDAMDQCGDAAVCALKCFSLVASAPAIHVVPSFYAHADAWTETPALHAHVIPPPTHPPPARALRCCS